MTLTKIAAAVKVHIAKILTDKFSGEISELAKHIKSVSEVEND